MVLRTYRLAEMSADNKRVTPPSLSVSSRYFPRFDTLSCSYFILEIVYTKMVYYTVIVIHSGKFSFNAFEFPTLIEIKIIVFYIIHG